MGLVFLAIDYTICHVAEDEWKEYYKKSRQGTIRFRPKPFTGETRLKKKKLSGFIPRLGSYRSMTYLVKRSSSRDGNEQIGAVEKESLISGSSELRKELVSGGGIESIVNRLSKWVVSALFASIILLRHDGAALWAIIGSVSNTALSVALKRLLNQERPATTLRTDPGMPSSHAQSISFISVFAVLTVMEWLGTNKVSLFLSCFILSLGSYFIKLRVSQKLHTSSQVVVGAIVGSIFCALWYTTWNSLLFEGFESSLLVQVPVFLVAAAFALSFAVYVVLNWFKEDR